MDTSLPTAPEADSRTDSPRPVGAQRPIEEQARAVNRHEDAPTLTDQVVDGLPADAAAMFEKLQQMLGTPDEWMDASRTMVRANPLLAIGGAALVGAAIGVLASRLRER